MISRFTTAVATGPANIVGHHAACVADDVGIAVRGPNISKMSILLSMQATTANCRLG
jgi:hypothetical protein